MTRYVLWERKSHGKLPARAIIYDDKGREVERLEGRSIDIAERVRLTGGATIVTPEGLAQAKGAHHG